MKKLNRVFIALFCVASFFCVSLTFAQERGFSSSVGLGVSFPNSPDFFEDTWQRGINISGGFYYSVNEFFQVGVQSGWYRLKVDSDRLKEDFENIEDFFGEFTGINLTVSHSGNDISVFTFMPSIRFVASTLGRVVPFVQAGLGYFRLGINDGRFLIETDFDEHEEPSPAETESAFGYMVSGGMEVSLNNSSSLAFDVGWVVGQVDPEVVDQKVDTVTLVPVELRYIYRW